MVDGYIEPLQRQITALADRVAALENLSTPEDRAAATAKAAEAAAAHLKENPGQTIAASRLPLAPGLPIAPYDPDTQGVDQATEDAMAAETDAREKRRKPAAPIKITDGPKDTPLPPIEPPKPVTPPPPPPAPTLSPLPPIEPPKPVPVT